MIEKRKSATDKGNLVGVIAIDLGKAIDSLPHYSDVMMSVMASQITALTIVYLTVY